MIRHKYTEDILEKKHDIKIFKETNKKRRIISQKFYDKENNIIHYVSSPITSNNKTFGVAIISHIINEE